MVQHPLPDQPWNNLTAVPFERSWENITGAYPMGQFGTRPARIRAELPVLGSRATQPRVGRSIYHPGQPRPAPGGVETPLLYC